MSPNLVIVESPAKAKTINKILGNDFVVKASMGHVRDLPINNLGVEVDNGFKPKYVNVKGRAKVLTDLKKAAAGAGTVYLAPDPDREGEAIAWHLREALGGAKSGKQFCRVQYNEITPRAVREAFEHPGDINMNRVEAQQARRILDRIVGYKVSPLLWRRIKRGLSAGRVQSVALRLVCEREMEIRGFVPEAFWLIGARVRKQVEPLVPFLARLVRVNNEKLAVKTAEAAEGMLADLKTRILHVVDVAVRTIHKRPYPPFITSSMQQGGSTFCGFSPSRTMAIAQRLYEGVDLGEGPVGLITYMRTDSFSIAAEAQQACREYIRDSYGPAFVPEKPNAYKRGDLVQGAHEAIRPTDVKRTPESLKDILEKPEWRLYDLIWRRFVASQMSPAEIEQRTARIRADKGPDTTGTAEYLFQASASVVTFAGYMQVIGTEIKKRDENNPDEQADLPPLTAGEQLECLEWKQERKETQPPSRYSEASLVKALESNGVGRPSTFAQTLATLSDRGYVTKDKQSLTPTELGLTVNGILVKDLGELFDVKFTASMEESLDRVENGEIGWADMLKAFYERFTKWVGAVEVPVADSKAVQGMLDALSHVTKWHPEVKRGKRTYSDEKFVESVGQQSKEGKTLSERQLKALVTMAIRYREEIPDLEAILQQHNMMAVLAETPDDASHEASLGKLAVLEPVELTEGGKKFVDSLREQVQRGRRLSVAQVRALDRIVISRANQIPDFENIKAKLGITENVEPMQKDETSGQLLAALQQVSQWKAAVKRGNRVFDDKKFYESLSQYYQQRQMLSERQQAALRKLVGRYRDQVAGAAELLGNREGEGVAGHAEESRE